MNDPIIQVTNTGEVGLTNVISQDLQGLDGASSNMAGRDQYVLSHLHLNHQKDVFVALEIEKAQRKFSLDDEGRYRNFKGEVKK